MKNKTILIVDDTITNLDILVELLSNYNLVEASSGKDALDIVDEKKVDLILLDIMMPEMDGFEVCSLIKQNNKTKHIPVIFLTAISDEISIEKAYNAGGFDYVTKPFKPKELQYRVKTQLHLEELKNKELAYNKQMALSELINNIAHHWRQPLSSISTIASGLSLKKEFGMIEEDEIIHSCKNIVNQTQYLSRTLDTITKLLDKKSDVHEFNIKNIIDIHHHILFKDMNKESIDLILNIDETLNFNESQNEFISILTALIQNSIDVLTAIERDKKVLVINIKKVENSILLEYYDSGLGIDDKNLKRIFEPYFTTKHQSQDKGLSLFLVQNIITTIFGGSLNTYNHEFEYEGEEHSGLKFDILLPMA